MKITKNISLKDLALIVGKVLFDADIDAVLTGGAVVSIYTDNMYQSFDLDFITHSSYKKLEKALMGTGFFREGRYFRHPETDFFIDFPAPPIAIGNKPIYDFNEIITDERYLKLLTPTHCVMDRLAAFYFWKDNQSLYQAVMVALKNEVNLKEIEEWSIDEGMLKKFNQFVSELKKKKR